MGVKGVQKFAHFKGKPNKETLICDIYMFSVFQGCAFTITNEKTKMIKW